MARVLVPWVSLGAGIAGALMMDRGPEQGLVVAIAAVSVWAILPVLQVLRRVPEAGRRPRVQRILQLAHFGAVSAVQWAIQTALFFSLPFFWYASAGTPGHYATCGALGAAALLSLWDPLTLAWMHRPIPGSMLAGLASFAGLLAVLPGFGLSVRDSLWAAATGTVLGVPLMTWSQSPLGARLVPTLVSLLVTLAWPGALWLGLARHVPAAPLRLLDAEVGIRQIGRGVADPRDHFDTMPNRLMCATAIWAPLGLGDRLFHVWKKDGEEVDRIELEVRGGRKDGFRTWSIKHHFPADAAGTWSCAVETESGQFLGEKVFTVGQNAT